MANGKGKKKYSLWKRFSRESIKNSLYGILESKDQQKYLEAAKPFRAEAKRSYDIMSNMSSEIHDITGDFNTEGKTIKDKPTEYSYQEGWESPQGGIDVIGSPHIRKGATSKSSMTNARGDEFRDVLTDSGSFSENITNTPEGKIVSRTMGRGKDAMFGIEFPKMGDLPARTFSFTRGGEKYRQSKAPSGMSIMELIKMNLKKR